MKTISVKEQETDVLTEGTDSKNGWALWVYPVLTGLLSVPFWIYLSINGLNEDTVVMVLGLLWCPGISALICRLIFSRNLKGMGWGAGKPVYLIMSLLIPLVYCLAAYVPLWLTGAAPFDFSGFRKQFDLLWYLFLLVSILVGALGEEIGWRGYFTPLLTKRYGFTISSLVTGSVWALWHFPLLIFTNYRSFENPSAGFLTPLWFALLFFSLTLVANTFVYTWLRLKSGSLWTAVALHASHNFLLMNFFSPLTGETLLSPWLVSETGAGLMVVSLVLAFIVWKKRGYPAVPG